MSKTLLASAIGLVLSANALANSYQIEASASYLNIDTNDSSANVDGAFASGTYYFSPVSTDNHPLQEAAFLSKNGSISLVDAYFKSTGGDTYQFGAQKTKYTYTDKSNTLIVSADGYLFDGLVYLGAAASHNEDKYTSTEVTTSTNPASSTKSSDSEKDSGDSWHANLGVSPMKGLLIWSGFEKDVDVAHSWNLNAKYVMEFDGKALNIQGGIGENSLAILDTSIVYPSNLRGIFAGDNESDINSAYVMGDYYFDKTFSLGVGANYIDSNDDDLNNSYMIRGQKFFSESFGLQFQYTKNSDFDTYSLGATVRF